MWVVRQPPKEPTKPPLTSILKTSGISSLSREKEVKIRGFHAWEGAGERRAWMGGHQVLQRAAAHNTSTTSLPSPAPHHNMATYRYQNLGSFPIIAIYHPVSLAIFVMTTLKLKDAVTSEIS